MIGLLVDTAGDTVVEGVRAGQVSHGVGLAEDRTVERRALADIHNGDQLALDITRQRDANTAIYWQRPRRPVAVRGDTWCTGFLPDREKIIGNPIEPVIKLPGNPCAVRAMSEHVDRDVSGDCCGAG